jgi:hypothetical protein
MDYYEECEMEAKAGYGDYENLMDNVDKAWWRSGYCEGDTLQEVRERFEMEFYGVQEKKEAPLIERDFHGTFKWDNFPVGEPNIELDLKAYGF